MKNFDWKKMLPYLVAIVLFLGFALFYCSPLLDGKVLNAGDARNWEGAAQEAKAFREQTGETTWWTNSMFGGMPTYQITGSTPSGSLRTTLEHTTHFGFYDEQGPIGTIFAYLIGFYLMLLCFGVNPWLSLVGSFALTLSSYFMLIIPAGHMTKANAIGCLAPMIGGMYAIFQRKYWLGAPLFALFGIIGITLHPQMSYYVGLLMSMLGLAELYIHITAKRFKELGTSIGVLLLCALLIFGSKLSWWQMNDSYLAETMRGGHSELAQKESADKPSAGLDIDYATAWSYGVGETMTLLIPNYQGACSGYDLGDDSQLEKDLKKMGVPGRQAKQFCQSAPIYWGEKAFTAGPVYVGAIICVLFLLGLLIVPGPYKWALLAATLFSITLAWGRNFMGWTELFFYHFPMYNKFRAVESILIVAEITMPLLGFLALQHLVKSDDTKRNLKMIGIAGGVAALVCLYVALFGSGFNVASSYDEQWKGQVGDQIYDAILNQRRLLLTASAWRSLLFVLLGTAALWFYTWKREKKSSTLAFTAVLGVLVLADMLPVNREFFGEQNFITAKNSAKNFAVQPWEAEILKDTTLDFRVFNMAANTFNDSRTSYRLKSIGGYHAAKLRRYQDLIEAHISQNNWQVIHMLNTRYIITRDGQIHLNPEAMGNAWFVDELVLANTPDEESEALRTLDLKHQAVADKKFADVLDVNKPEATLMMSFDEEYIRMTKYAPNRLEYDFQAERNKLVVFSEIFYPVDWHLYIDGEEYPIGRVNYTLRGAVIPAGRHSVVMEFVPGALSTDKWCLALLILVLIGSAIALTFPLWRNRLPKCNKKTSLHSIAAE